MRKARNEYIDKGKSGLQVKVLIGLIIPFLMGVEACSVDSGPSDKHNLKLVLTNVDLKSRSRFLVLLTGNNHEANFIEIDFSSEVPRVLEFEKWQQAGVLLDTFYSRTGAASLTRKVSKGSYFAHVFDQKGRKAVVEFNDLQLDESRTEVAALEALGHIKIRVYQSSIGADIDSNRVSLYDSTQAVFQLLDSVYFTDLPISPLHETRSGIFKNEFLRLETGRAYFFNLPVRSFWGGAFNEQLAPRGQKSSTIQRIQVEQNLLLFYPMRFK